MKTIRNNIVRLLVQLSLFAGLMVMLSGCASMEMKGTPFYTGDYETRKGPAEDRVNIWPLMYYRSPALSVAWPVVELTDDHFAVRPLMSVYGLGQKDKTYNLLWPLGQFDCKSGDNRVFPVFWGHDYFKFFPLYWHLNHPFEGNGYDGLFPLWSYDVDGGGYDLYFPSFIGHIKNNASGKGWHLWPLAGNYSRKNGYYRFLFWPLGHQWSDLDAKTSGDAFIPLYLRCEDHGESVFFSLPWSFGAEADGSSWKFAPPFFYQSSDSKGSRFLSLVYSKGHDASYTDEWSLLLPLYYSHKSGADKTVATLLGGYRKSGDHSSWLALPLLSGGTRGPDSGSIWAAGPLVHAAWDAGSSLHHVFPLYYRSSDAAGSRFFSVPWSTSCDNKGNGWQLVPPLFFRKKSDLREMFVTPLYYWDGDDKTLVSPLLARWKNEKGSQFTALPPLLSVFESDGESSSLLTLCGMARFGWGRDPGVRYLLPLFYSDNDKDVFVSPAYTRWHSGDGSVISMVPPAFSWMSQGKLRSDLWVGGPLAHFSWGERAGSQHIFPLYYSDPEAEMILSLPFMKWNFGNRKTVVIPPLLSGYSSDGIDMDITGLLGLFRNSWEPDVTKRSGYLFPLYYYDDKRLFTPLLGRSTEPGDSFFYPLTPLFGVYTGARSGGWLFPLFSHNREKRSGTIQGSFLWGQYWREGRKTGSGFFPVYGYWNDGVPCADLSARDCGEYGKTFISLPACWYRNKLDVQRGKDDKPVVSSRKSNGVFPLWTYSKAENLVDRKEDVDASMLLAVYDYKREIRPVNKDGEGRNEYIRARILWRLWHYERSNDDVSVDLFPAITYDRKSDRFKKVSFLWRFFRYERDGEGRKLDLVFVPIVRSGAK